MYQNQFFKKIENWQVSEHRCTRADNQQVREYILKMTTDRYLSLTLRTAKRLVISILPNPSHEEWGFRSWQKECQVHSSVDRGVVHYTLIREKRPHHSNDNMCVCVWRSMCLGRHPNAWLRDFLELENHCWILTWQEIDFYTPFQMVFARSFWL
jgi:hypothetical protein